MPDNIQIEILEDGTLKVTSDPISAPNHANAEEFLRYMAQLAGGETSRARRTDAHHTHGQDQTAHTKESQ